MIPRSLFAFLRDLATAARQGVRQVRVQQQLTADTLAHVTDEAFLTIPRDTPIGDAALLAVYGELLEDWRREVWACADDELKELR